MGAHVGMHVLCVCGLVSCVDFVCGSALVRLSPVVTRVAAGGASDGEDVRTSRNLTSETGHGHGGHFTSVGVSRREMRAHRVTVRRSIFSFIYEKNSSIVP